ncbi:MAG TPA: SGNH/GDSL hydrolase family protein [Candidatus Fournierella merdigallinarum]|nr:SGNH/GDSL hydrolase family protein [Candidatus Fournierella merdigallinarum]
MPQKRRNSRGGSQLTAKQKQAALVLGICVLVLVIVIAVVAVWVSGSGDEAPQSGSSQPSSTSSGQVATGGLDASKYGDAVLGTTDDAGKEYIDETLFVGDSNTYRYYQYALLELDQVVAVEGLGIQSFTTDKSIYFKGDDAGYSIPEAIAKMKPRRVIVMMGTNNADGSMSASDFASNYRTALEAIKTAYPYTDIIVAAVPPIPEDHSSYPSMSMDTINQFNEALAQLCADDGYKFLNISEILVDTNGYGKAQYYLAGDIHLKKDALTAIMDYARTHAYLGTEDRRPDTDNIPERRKTGSTGTVTATPTPTPDEKTYTAQYKVDKNVGGTLTSGDQKDKTSLSFKDLTSESSVSVTAVPAKGYEFLKWSDGNTNATRTDKNFKQNLDVTAMFGAEFVITIREGSSGTITLGETFGFSATVSDRSNINVDNDIFWTVNGTEIRRGISGGYKPDKAGTYEIKANVTLNGKTYSATYTLTVKEAPITATGITVNGGTTVESTGGNVTLTASVSPSNAEGTVTWSVSSGATLSATTGTSTTVTVPANGDTSNKTYTVTAKIGNVSGTATITVKGVAPKTMNLTISGPTSLTVGQTGEYSVAGAPDGSTFTWEGASGTGATATLTPADEGTVTVKVTVKCAGYTDGTATCTVNVAAAAAGGEGDETQE